MGVTVIDYDVLAREVVAKGTPGATAVAAEFGTLNRAELARLAFASDDARLRLEAIVHPLVYQAAARQEADAIAAGERLVVHEIPLLAEVVDPAQFDQVVVVDAPAELRARRLVEGRGMSQGEANGRIAAQATDERRREIASVIWDGSGSPEHLREQVRHWITSLPQF